MPGRSRQRTRRAPDLRHCLAPGCAIIRPGWLNHGQMLQHGTKRCPR